MTSLSFHERGAFVLVLVCVLSGGGPGRYKTQEINTVTLEYGRRGHEDGGKLAVHTTTLGRQADVKSMHTSRSSVLHRSQATWKYRPLQLRFYILTEVCHIIDWQP